MPSGPTAVRRSLTIFAWLSVVAAVATIALKTGAYLLTDSVGLLSDAAESVVNLIAAFAALIALHVAAKPADHDHHYGHAKAEYFAAGIEGMMIFVAAVFIVYAAVDRFLNPVAIGNVGLGLAISGIASVINGIVGFVLVRAGRKYASITLEADGKHLWTDVWTSVGVIVGVALVALTGWQRLDPILAFLVGCNIIWTGWGLIRRSVDGLMDRALSPGDQRHLSEVLAEMASDDVHFHNVRCRESGHLQFATMHVLVPGHWSVQQGHDLLETVEGRIHERFPHMTVTTHLEPREDPRAYEPDLGITVGEFPPPTKPADKG